MLWIKDILGGANKKYNTELLVFLLQIISYNMQSHLLHRRENVNIDFLFWKGISFLRLAPLPVDLAKNNFDEKKCVYKNSKTSIIMLEFE